MKRPLPALALLLLISCGKADEAAAPPPPPPQARPLDEAKQLLDQARTSDSDAAWTRALEKLDAAVKADPRSAEALEARAEAKLRLGMPALEDASQAASLDPSRAAARTIRGLAGLVEAVRANGGLPGAPAAILMQAVRKALPESAPLLAGPGALPPGFGEIPKPTWDGIRDDLQAGPDHPQAKVARKLFQSNAEFTPEEERVMERLLTSWKAGRLAARGEWDEAHAAARGAADSAGTTVLMASAIARGRGNTAVSMGNKDVPVHRALNAVAVLQSGSPGEVAEELEAVRKDLPLLLFQVERAYRKLAAGDDLEGAVETLREAAVAAPANPAVLHALGLALFTAGRPAEAVAELEKVTAPEGQEETAWRAFELLAWAHMAAGDNAKGRDALLKAAALKVDKDLAKRWLGPVRANDDADGLVQLGTLIATRLPSEAAGWRARAQGCYKREKWSDTIQAVREALEARIEPKEVLEFRALAREEKESLIEAHADWDALLTTEPDRAQAYANRGHIRAQMGRFEEARDDASKAISMGPAFEDRATAWYTLALVYAHLAEQEPEGEDRARYRKKAADALRSLADTGAFRAKDLEEEGPPPLLKDSEEWKEILRLADEKFLKGQEERKSQGLLGIATDGRGHRLVVLSTVPRSPARKACMAPEDVLLEIDGKAVRSPQDFTDKLAGRRPGSLVAIRFERGLRPGLNGTYTRQIEMGSRAILDENEEKK